MEAVPTVDRETTPEDVIKAVQHKPNHKASYNAAHEVLRSLQGTNVEAEREQSRHARALVEVMNQTDRPALSEPQHIPERLFTYCDVRRNLHKKRIPANTVVCSIIGSKQRDRGTGMGTCEE